MAIVNGSLQSGYKNSAWFTANPTLVLKEGQIVYLEQTGTYKLGDGVTQLSALTFLGGGGTVDVNTIGATINGATSATPNDTDLVMSVDTSVAKKNTWTQIKAFLKTYFDTVYATITDLTGYVKKGTLTTNYIPKATATDTIGNSQITDDGTTVAINTTDSSSKLEIKSTNGNLFGGAFTGMIAKIYNYWDGNTFALDLNRNTSSGVFDNANVAFARILMYVSNNNSYIQFRTSNTNNSLGSTALEIDKDGKLNLPLLTASQIVATDASKNLQSLDTATYPSLTELAFLKGTTSSVQTQLNALSGARDRKYFAYDNTSYSYTGTTADTIVKTISIPANSMLANSTLDLFMNFFKSGTTNTQGMYLYITTNSGAITGGTRIGSNGQGGTTTLQYGKRFRLSNKNSQTSQLGQTSSNNAQDFSSPLAGAKQVLAIDFTVQQYIHIVTFLIGGSSDTIGISDYQMYIDHV